MKTSLTPRFRFLWSALLLLLLSGCDRTPSASTSNASYQATREFWDAIHQPHSKQADLDAISQLRLNDPDPAHAQLVRNGFRGLAKSASDKTTRITSLPLLNVDPDAVAYAAKAAEYRKELSELCEAVAGKSESDERIPDELMMSFLLGFARHAKDQDGILLNVAKDSAVQAGETLSSTRAEWVALLARLKAFTSRGDSLRIEQMAVRAKLSSRYGHEFPAPTSYPNVVGGPAPKP